MLRFEIPVQCLPWLYIFLLCLREDLTDIMGWFTAPMVLVECSEKFRGVIGWRVEEEQGVTALATGRNLVGVRKRCW